MVNRRPAEILETMATWFTADLHFGHGNIIDYCRRPFGDVDAMNQALIDNWNAFVDPDDTVWVLGDFALGSLAESLPLAARLHGDKILVPGNHDRCWHGRGRRADGWAGRYRDAGFDDVVDGPTRITIGDRSVLASHFPYEGDSHGDDRFVDHRPVDEGGWLLHGHVHESWAQNDRMINVGVDVAGYHPVPEATITALIEAGPAKIADFSECRSSPRRSP